MQGLGCNPSLPASHVNTWASTTPLSLFVHGFLSSLERSPPVPIPVLQQPCQGLTAPPRVIVCKWYPWELLTWYPFPSC